MRLANLSPAEQLHSISARWRAGLARRPFLRRGSQHHRAGALPNEGAVPASANESAENETDAPRQRLEAILFLAREPLPARKLSQFAGLADGTAARTLIRHLNQGYDAAGRAFRIEEVAGGFQMLSRAKFARWLRRLGHVPHETRLSAPALETLAVVAYRQPVLRAEIEAVRGVSCGEILRLLLERDLVRIGGRSDELGRPYLYCTTRRFLQMFGLKNLEELPRAAAIRRVPLASTAGFPVQLANES